MTGTDYERFAELLHEARIMREAARMARADRNPKEEERFKRKARYLEEQAEAIDPRHEKSAWHTEA